MEHGIKVMSVQFMLEAADAPVVWRGPRKTALIKRFVKDTFWGRLDYLVVGMRAIMSIHTQKPHAQTHAPIRRACAFCVCAQ